MNRIRWDRLQMRYECVTCKLQMTQVVIAEQQSYHTTTDWEY